MEINQEIFFEIFTQNTSFRKVNTIIGSAIEMNSYDAFCYSLITGACYLDNPVYPFTPKGTFDIFHSALNYNFVTGMFENAKFRETPFTLYEKKPYIFNTTKYIVPVSFSSEQEYYLNLERVHFELTRIGINTTDFIIQRIETKKKGNGMEPFLEYLAYLYFKEQGYIVENQIALGHALGTPDFGAYYLHEVFESLNKFNLFGRGFHVIELGLIRLFNPISSQHYLNLRSSHAIVAEAKTSTKMMTEQLHKYLKTGYYTIGYEMHPSKSFPDKNYFGLISLDDSLNLKILHPESVISNNIVFQNNHEYIRWLVNYTKYYILSNLSQSEFENFLTRYNVQTLTNNNIVNTVNSIDFDELLTVVYSYFKK